MSTSSSSTGTDTAEPPLSLVHFAPFAAPSLYSVA
jgi:hypothetical protein